MLIRLTVNAELDSMADIPMSYSSVVDIINVTYKTIIVEEFLNFTSAMEEESIKSKKNIYDDKKIYSTKFCIILKKLQVACSDKSHCFIIYGDIITFAYN